MRAWFKRGACVAHVWSGWWPTVEGDNALLWVERKCRVCGETERYESRTAEALRADRQRRTEDVAREVAWDRDWRALSSAIQHLYGAPLAAAILRADDAEAAVAKLKEKVQTTQKAGADE